VTFVKVFVCFGPHWLSFYWQRQL